jgi:hypothetical protein
MDFSGTAGDVIAATLLYGAGLVALLATLVKTIEALTTRPQPRRVPVPREPQRRAWPGAPN